MNTSTWFATLLFAASASAQISGSPPDRETALRFGETVAIALNERDDKSLSSLLDIRGLAMRAGRIEGKEGAALRSFSDRFEKSESSGILAAVFNKLDLTQGTAVFLRLTGTRPARPLVRLDLGDNGNDYLEFVLETRGGRTRAVDWFQLSTGELMSVTMSGVGQLFATNDTGPLARMLGIGRGDPAAMGHWRRASEFQQAGKYQESLGELQQLPEPIVSARVILTFQLSMATRAKNVAEQTRILSRLAEKYSNDPATAHMLLDHYFTIGDLPNMLRSLDTMEKRVGIDGVTRNYRATAYFSRGDYANTLKYADEAIRVEPTLLAAHDTRGSALVGLASYADAVAHYKSLAQRFELEFTRETFTRDPFFAKFVASAPFREWLPN
jgi:tetratricopeptide (TPR) repeat protein